MAAFLDNCKFTPTAGGTTDWTYSAAVTGYQSPSAAGVVNGTKYKYFAVSSDLTQWEIGEGAYNTTTGVLPRTTVLFNSSGTTAKISFNAAPSVAIVALAEDLARNAGQWTHTLYTSGSGTYSLPTGCKAIRVRMVGGGGGGGGGGTGRGAGTNGGNTTFGTSLLTANGGSGADAGGDAGAAGSASGGILNFAGSAGLPESTLGTGAIGGQGGGSAFGGEGFGGGIGAAGGNAAANSGSGGGGGGSTASTTSAGGGGGAGGFVESLITSPASSYAYAVGAAGSGGTAGTSGGIGGQGAAGIILIEEYY